MWNPYVQALHRSVGSYMSSIFDDVTCGGLYIFTTWVGHTLLLLERVHFYYLSGIFVIWRLTCEVPLHKVLYKPSYKGLLNL